MNAFSELSVNFQCIYTFIELSVSALNGKHPPGSAFTSNYDTFVTEKDGKLIVVERVDMHRVWYRRQFAITGRIAYS